MGAGASVDGAAASAADMEAQLAKLQAQESLANSVEKLSNAMRRGQELCGPRGGLGGRAVAAYSARRLVPGYFRAHGRVRSS